MRKPRRLLSTAACLLAAICVLTPASSALGASSSGTAEQIAWVRSAASRFVAAELAHNGEGACGVLNAPLRATIHGRTCAQRWDSKLSVMLRNPAKRHLLKAQARAIPSAAVVVRGNVAQLQLSKPLISGPNKFLWTEMCWMLEG
jgi:hypothetical protein